MKRTRRILTTLAIFTFLSLWLSFMYFIGPVKFVNWIGVTNGYVILFLIGSLGGSTSLTVATFYTLIVTLAAGGLNPWILGLLGGTGVAIGDSVFFFLGMKGKDVLYGKFEKHVDKLACWLEKGPSWLVPIATFIYVGMTPLPNELYTISMGLTGVKYKQLVIPLLLGDIFLATVLASLTYYGYAVIV